MSAVASRTDRRSRLIASLFSLPFLVMGGGLAAVGMGWIPHRPGSMHAPPWVIVVCGMIFIAGGLAVLSKLWTAGERTGSVFGAAILVGLTLVCNWVAFGEGERRFTRTTSISGNVVNSRPMDERSGRMAFGVGAAMLDFILILLVVRHWRRRARRRRDGRVI